ncbi:MAG: T9SS type A sorting domain-containing protein, partial [Chitinophagaceae bacterium]
GSFTWGDDTPAFVFSNMLGMNVKYVAEACSHESGHALLLSHQSKYDNSCNILQNYNEGIGTGETSWAPVMGNSYYRNLSGWNNGLTPSSCTEEQDNLSIITGYNNFTYRADDHSSDVNTGFTPINITSQAFSTSGVITNSTDKDYFQLIASQSSTLHLDATPFSVGPNNEGANLDIKICLLDNSKQVIRTYDPVNMLNAVIDTVLNGGTYYLMVKGSGNSNASDYGSLGSYTISGTVSPLGVTPIRDIALSGKVLNSKHQLDWKVTSDEPIKNIEIETSINSAAFGSLTNVAVNANRFAYSPFENTNILYRLKVTSTMGQVAFSNVIMLKGNANAANFDVSTLVQNELTINASSAYEFQIIDVNGRMLMKGKRSAGINRENLNAFSSGIYVLQILSNNEKITQRIIKQ